MKIVLIQFGETTEKYLKEGILIYTNRLANYCSFEQKTINNSKLTKLSNSVLIKKAEGELLLTSIQPTDFLVLLDEQGKQNTSTEFANYLQQRMNSGIKQLIFVIGGAYGFSDEIYKRANAKLSFSNLTFSHQMIRLFFAEQLYRSFTIIKGEKYHHQ